MKIAWKMKSLQIALSNGLINFTKYRKEYYEEHSCFFLSNEREEFKIRGGRVLTFRCPIPTTARRESPVINGSTLYISTGSHKQQDRAT
jgi:hypothetical protein